MKLPGISVNSAGDALMRAWISHTARVDQRHADLAQRMQGEEILALLGYCLALAIPALPMLDALARRWARFE